MTSKTSPTLKSLAIAYHWRFGTAGIHIRRRVSEVFLGDSVDNTAALLLKDDADDIPDPYGGTQAEYHSCLNDALAPWCAVVAENLCKGAEPSDKL